MTSVCGDGKNKSKGRIPTRLGFITAATMLVTASLFIAHGTAPNFAATAQMAQTQSSTNTTQQQDQNQTSTSPFSTALERLREQSRMHQQQQASMNITEDARQKAMEASHAVDGVLIYYAKALGDPNIERINITDPNASVINVRIPAVPLSEESQNATTATGGGNIVSQADYLIAQGLAVKAMESFSEGSASAVLTADPVTLEQLADTQQGLSLLFGMIKNRDTYNLVEDVTSTIKSNLEHIYGATTAEVT